MNVDVLVELEGAYLYRMDEALAQSQRDDTQGKVSHSRLSVEEGLQNLLQVNLHDGATHAR